MTTSANRFPLALASTCDMLTKKARRFNEPANAAPR
jgi:hypothetical protein